MLPRLTSFSTRRAPRGNEVDYWRQARQEAYVSVRTDPVGSTFKGEINLAQYADFRLSTKRACPEEVRRSASDIAQGRENEEYLYIAFQLSGTLLVEQAGRQAIAAPGSMVIYDSAEPFFLSAKGDYEQVVLELPADAAYSLAGMNRSHDLLARAFDCAGATGAVAAFFVNLAQSQEADRLGAHHLQPHATALGASLLGLLAPGPCGMPESLRRSKAVAYMRAHLADPDLDAETIAEGLHVSRRTLFRLFEGTGESAMTHLRSLRLERARLLLRTQPDKQISTIALETGFSSAVQFYRAFRTVTGMTPGDYREAHVTQGPAARAEGTPPAGPAGREERSAAMDPDRLDASLARITRIPFRAKFHLRPPEREYVAFRGMDVVRRHARELIDARLAPARPVKDGRQTPWGGHPVFRAQHATATCCRTCLQINHGIPKGHELSERERQYVVDLICRWIENEARAGRGPRQDPPPALF
ncbi:hypothetical protein GCM10023082_63900 [Streptomyces tremellae]|uniref:HTH araC/xylS-type domain-containing protein n=1 Tax=Streptomyces tremellae TaxID=1124239 RepID=A0ABP7GEE7_9ACTN